MKTEKVLQLLESAFNYSLFCFPFAGEIKMNVQKKTYIITVTTYQMAILLLFNDGDNLSYAYVCCLFFCFIMFN